MAEKLTCEVKCFETDDGLKIEIKGKNAKQCMEAWKAGKCC